MLSFNFWFSFCTRWQCGARKGPYALPSVSQQSIHGCLRSSANVCLVEHRSFPTEAGGSASSFLHYSFFQAISVVMLWPVHVQKVPQASKHLCPTMLQTRCDISCACQSVCPFIPTDSVMPRAVDPQTPLPKTEHGCVPVGAVHPDSTSCRRFIESVRIKTCVIYESLWETSHCAACVTTSTSMVRLEIVTLWAPLSSCTGLPPSLNVNPQPDRSFVTEPSV